MLEFLLLDHDRYVASAASHDVAAPAGAGEQPPVGDTAPDVGPGYAQGARLKVVVVLGVGHGGTHRRGHQASVGGGHEAEQGYRLVHPFAPYLVQDQPRLLGRDGGVTGEGSHFHLAYTFRTRLTWADLPP